MSKLVRAAEHIQEAIEKIEKYSQRGKEAFQQEELVQTWIVYHLQVMGEAARSVPPEERKAHPDIPWRKLIGLRNILVHEYFHLEADRIWQVVEKELPSIKKQLEAILEKAR